MQKKIFNYRTILNNISDKIFYLDADFNVNWANQAAVKYFDLNIEAMKDQKCFKKWKQNKKCKDCPVIKAKETKNIEECILEKDDDKRWKITAIPEINKAGEIEAMIEIVSDMTASKDISDKEKVEKEIEETKNLLQSLTNKTPGAVFQHRLLPNGTYLFTYASEDIYEIYEVTPEEAKADANKVIDRIHTEDYERVADSIKESAENLTVWEEEYRVELPEKGIRWIEGYAEPEKRPDGSVVWYGNIRDITKRKEKESKLQKQKEKYKEAKKSLENLSNLAPGVTHQYRLFPDGTSSICYISEGVSEIYELTAEEVTKDASKLFERIHPDDYERVFELIQKSAENLTVWEAEYKIILPDKGLRWVGAKAKPERLSDGSTLWYGNTHDITKRKKQQQSLKYQHKFQKTLAKVSTDLLEINSANIDRKINQSLAKIGKFLDVDRSYIIQLSEDNKFLSNTHEWCRNGVKSEKENFQNIPISFFSWSFNKLTQNQHINIADVDKMSKKAEPERRQIKDLGIKSLVIMPMFIENELFGFFVFDSVKNKRKISDEEIRLLNIFTDLIVNAFSKHINNKKIRKLTYKDRLTGLYNRRFFEEELQRFDNKRQLPISIIVADINGLKIINDSLGHKKGDQLLKKAADILDEVTREEDILARQGGDEFAILLPKTEKEKAEKVIARIKNKTKNTNSKELTVTIALGLAAKTDPDQSIEEILKAADNDMYQNKLSESRSTKSKIVQSLLNNLEVKSNETKEHTLRMTKLAFEFGKSLKLSNSELNRLSLLSTLHDIGKTTISEKMLKKAENLTDSEWEIMKEHSERGYKIANSSEEFALVAEDIFAHHERWDGSGYPRRIKGKNIPYLARIISIIDAYDVMTHNRPYSKALSKEEALAEIENCAGSQFDPELAAKFIRLMNEIYAD